MPHTKNFTIIIYSNKRLIITTECFTKSSQEVLGCPAKRLSSLFHCFIGGKNLPIVFKNGSFLAYSCTKSLLFAKCFKRFRK